MDSNKVWFEKICKMWEEGENRKEVLATNYEYWQGTNFKNPADSFFNKEKRTNCNMVNQLVEAKLSAMLDAQFDASVVPEIYSFSDMQEIDDIQAVADVLDTGLKKVLAQNKADAVKERVARWGFIKMGAVQVAWDSSVGENGEIVLPDVDPRNLRWTKGAKNVKELTWIGYSRDLDVAIAKRDYARNDDGSFDLELCKKLDEASGDRNAEKSVDNKSVGSYQVDGDNPSAGLAYVKSTTSKGIGKTVTVAVMFMFDGTVDAPEKEEGAEIEAEKQNMLMKYPNGRMLVFIPQKDKNIMLSDEPAPKAFKTLGNINIFNTIDLGSLDDGGEVDHIAPIQERINGTYRKLRALVGGDINTVLFDEKMRGIVDDNSMVNFPVMFIEALGSFQPPIINNGMIEKAINLMEILKNYKQEAREQARVNETWMNGIQQKGINSGDQVDSLNESAMASIRAIQRNFKDFWIGVCEQIVSLMVENYSEGRMLELATGLDQKSYAMFQSQQGADGKEQRSIDFIDQAGKIVKSIKINPNWKMKVEVSSGTDIPRTRREGARLADELAVAPIMQSGNIPMIKLYLDMKDVPKRRAIIKMMEDQQKEAEKNKPTVLEQLAKNPDLMKAWADLFKSLTGFSKAQGALLKKADLPDTTDTITSAPAQTITAKSQAKDIAIISPQQVSENKIQADFGNKQATDLELLQHTDKSPMGKGDKDEVQVQPEV